MDEIGDLGIPFRIRGDESKSVKTARTIETFTEWWRVFTTARISMATSKPELHQLQFSTTVYGGEWSSFTEPLAHERRFEAFCKIPDANLALNTTLPYLPPRIPAAQSTKTSPLPAEATEKDYLAMVSSASLRMHGKRFASTSKEKLPCLAPLETQKGDVVCILFGCSFPVVLRRKEKRYVLIGEIYVFGAMKGEMMENLGNRGKEEGEEFVIE